MYLILLYRQCPKTFETVKNDFRPIIGQGITLTYKLINMYQSNYHGQEPHEDKPRQVNLT